MFDHDLHDYVELETEFTPQGKFYILPTGERLPSVTTVLSKHHKVDLGGWRKRIGEKRANEISTRALNRGTAVHELCEKYVMNNPEYFKGAMSVNLSTFRDVKPVLDHYITKVYGVEFPLYSVGLNTAGTADLLCDWKGSPAVVDYKTSTRVKKEEWIQSYFEQATVYSIMATHLLKIPFLKFVVIMIVDNELPIIYEKSPLGYVKQVKEIFL